jgi:YHS domain-containing protein
MYKTRKFGFGLAAALGLMMTAPVMADEACQKTLASIDRTTGTLTKMQQFFDQMSQRQASGVASADAPLKCPACGMMMPTSPTATMTRAVKYNGKTYYCCSGCNMSATADKE